MKSFTMKSSVFLLGIGSAYGHVAFVAMYGETNGLTGKGFGTKDGAPRNVSLRDPGQLDSTIIREFEIKEGIASSCGRTILQGKLDIGVAMEKAEDGGLPDVGPKGIIRLIAHQVDKDGAGPYTCGVDTSAQGENFVTISVINNVPGQGGRSDTTSKAFSLEAQMPQGMKCQGGADNRTCIVRCTNGAASGPYGGCMAFTQMQGLYNDPAPAGSGPTPTFQLDRITENPVTRDPDLFDVARARMPADPLQVQPAAKTKGKKRSILTSNMLRRRVTGLVRDKRQKSSSANNNNNNNNNNSGNKLPGHVDTILPTEEGILFEISTAIIGQADTPANVRKSSKTKRSLTS